MLYEKEITVEDLIKALWRTNCRMCDIVKAKDPKTGKYITAKLVVVHNEKVVEALFG